MFRTASAKHDLYKEGTYHAAAGYIRFYVRSSYYTCSGVFCATGGIATPRGESHEPLVRFVVAHRGFGEWWAEVARTGGGDAYNL